MERHNDLVLITGASSGIGRAIALQLSRTHRLLLSGRDESRLTEVRNACADPEVHRICLHDLSNPALAIEPVLDVLRDESVAHFIHAAGTFSVTPVRAIDWDETLRMFQVNLFSAIELVRQLSRRKINRGGLRSITFMSSIASRVGFPGYHVYAATKGALNALARSLAIELAPATRVNSILPGPIETDGTRAVFADPDARRRIEASAPLGLGTPQDVASLAAFLVSEDARWITGQEFVVDGGRSIT
jgi:NAD(P)-dependent dehydrogenase (short-subunit alcohol dehydrogenase family)